MSEGLAQGLARAASRLARQAAATAGDVLERALDRQLRLAVTGLSQSGKTAFITALVHQLEQACAQGSRLPLWRLPAEGRLLGVRRVPQLNAHIPSFAFDAAMARLRGQPPAWPESTRGVSEIRLEIRYRPTGRFAREIGTLYLDLVDYPGEWLLDLPLLGLDYAAWSAEVAATLRTSPRMAALAAAWRQWAPGPDDPFEDSAARAAAAQYTRFLQACRTELGLSLLQPGRFLLPGDAAGAPMLQFLPWVQGPAPTEPAPGGTFATLAGRFEQYKHHLVRGFYREHFAGFDRQIVLVDCLHALDGGPECLADTQRALARIIESFRYGSGNRLTRLFNPRIDRVLFAASKADHVLPEQHAALVTLLQQLVQGGAGITRFEGVPSDCMALAAVAVTELASGLTPGGESVRGLRGHSLDGEPLLVRPRSLPEGLPGPQWWQGRGAAYDRFRPPDPDAARPLPHIRLDAALEFLLGDKVA